MGTANFLFNLDNGDLCPIGAIYEAAPNSNIGLDDSYGAVGYIASARMRAKYPESIKWFDNLADALAFFLASSFGCRLVVLSEDDLNLLFDDIERDMKADGVLKDGQEVYFETSGHFELRESLKAFNRTRLSNQLERSLPSGAADFKQYCERVLDTRSEIKSVLRKGLEEQKDGHFLYTWGSRIAEVTFKSALTIDSDFPDRSVEELQRRAKLE
ncbi:MAG: hypothetical protein AAGM38_01600 [Pseudomonadota bacterium]